MKKSILLAISLVLILTIAVTGTLAYLTDVDMIDGVYTMGDVDIVLQENFVQNSELLPGKTVTKQVMIKNNGLEPAYVWFTYSVPEVLDPFIRVEYTEAYVHGLHTDPVHYLAANLTKPADENKTWHLDTAAVPAEEPKGIYLRTETIDGIPYKTYAVYYHGILAPTRRTSIVMTGVHMDSAVKTGDYHMEELKFIVNAYAIQAALEGVDSVQEAAAVYAAQYPAP